MGLTAEPVTTATTHPEADLRVSAAVPQCFLVAVTEKNWSFSSVPWGFPLG